MVRTTEQERFRELTKLVLVHALKMPVYDNWNFGTPDVYPVAFWNDDKGCYCIERAPHETPTPFRPCEDWGSAGVVVEAMEAAGYELTVNSFRENDGWPKYCTAAWFVNRRVEPTDADAPTVQLATVLASIKAMGVELPPHLLNGGDQS